MPFSGAIKLLPSTTVDSKSSGSCDSSRDSGDSDSALGQSVQRAGSSEEDPSVQVFCPLPVRPLPSASLYEEIQEAEMQQHGINEVDKEEASNKPKNDGATDSPREENCLEDSNGLTLTVDEITWSMEAQDINRDIEFPLEADVDSLSYEESTEGDLHAEVAIVSHNAGSETALPIADQKGHVSDLELPSADQEDPVETAVPPSNGSSIVSSQPDRVAQVSGIISSDNFEFVF